MKATRPVSEAGVVIFFLSLLHESDLRTSLVFDGEVLGLVFGKLSVDKLDKKY